MPSRVTDKPLPFYMWVEYKVMWPEDAEKSEESCLSFLLSLLFIFLIKPENLLSDRKESINDFRWNNIVKFD